MTRKSAIERLQKIGATFRRWEELPGGELLLRSGWAYLVLWLNGSIGGMTAHKLGIHQLSLIKRLSIVLKTAVGLFTGASPVLATSGALAASRCNLVVSWRRSSDLPPCHDDYFGDMTPSLTPDLIRVYLCVPGVQVALTENIDGVFTFLRRPAENLRWVLRLVALFPFRPWRATLADLSPERRIAVSIQVQLSSWFRSSGLNLHSLLMPYEQQPWQCELCAYANEAFPDCKTIGYVHSSLTNFPSQFSKHKYTPMVLLTHGTADRRVLIDCLGWTAEAVHMVHSLRFIRPIQLDCSTVFLPFAVDNPDEVVQAFHAIRNAGCFKSGQVDIRIHPMRCQIKAHKDLRDSLLLQVSGPAYQDPPTQTSVLTVGVTNATLEALEAGYETFSLVEDLERDGFPPDVWRELSMEAICPNVYRLALANKGAFLSYGNGDPTPIRVLLDLA